METIVTESLRDEKSLLQEWIHRWGSSVSEVALDPSCLIFRTPGIDGFIGYRIESGCAIIYGDPVCAPEDMPSLALTFYSFCQANHLRLIYIIVSEPFASWAIDHVCNVMIEVGEELTFDPFENPKEGSNKARLRNKLRHAGKLGLKVNEYLSYDEKLEHAMKQAGAEWLKGRRGPQIYLGYLNFFDHRIDKRWFYVQDGDSIIGTALLSKLEARKGWLLKFLIITPKAPRGTSELLMMTILETLKKEGCHFLTNGMVPAEKIGQTVGLGKFSTWLARKIFKIARWFFKLQQRKTYWEQFSPKAEKVYLLFSEPNLSLQEIRAVMKALKIDFF